MKGLNQIQRTIFQQSHEERLNQIKYGLKVHYKWNNDYERYEEIVRLRNLLQKKHCLGLYNMKGFLVCKIQPFQLQLIDEDGDSFCTTSVELESGLFNHSTYYLNIYRNASDYGYKNVLSKRLDRFEERDYESQELIDYIKGRIPRVEPGQLLHFKPQDQPNNPNQRKAIIKSGLVSTLIIQGPPGVGKSLVGCKIGVEYLLKGKKVIMVTVTKVGAKAISEHMVGELSKHHDQMLHARFLRAIKGILRVRAELINPEMQNMAIDILDRQIKKIVKELQEKPDKFNFLYFNLLTTLEEYFSMQSFLRFYSFNSHLIINIIRLTKYKMPVLEILTNLNRVANKIAVTDDFKEIYFKAVRTIIKNADLVITNAGRAAEINRYQVDQQRFRPFLAIFDEAAQATLENAYCIFSLNIKKLFVIGDEKQLPPDTKTPQLMQNTLFSIMKRLPNRNLYEFNAQYRMHPEIAKLVSYLSYEGELKNGFKVNRNISQIQGFSKYPVFMLTHNFEEEIPIGRHEHGYYNIHEIKMIKLYIDQFHDSQLKDIGIVTSYRAQEIRLRQIFSKEIKLGLSISTVNGYQGAEKDYIIYSAVRSNALGLLGFSEDKNRLNVALSRARKGLMVVGNANTLLCGHYDNPWKYVINYLWQIESIFQFPQELNQRADQSYLTRKERDSNIEIEAQKVFDADSEDGSDTEDIIPIDIDQDENDELPFIESNYN